MHRRIQEIVDAVIREAIQLRRDLEAQRALDVPEAQTKLLELLRLKVDADLIPEYGGSRHDEFLGIRYVLVCWLDDIFGDSRAREGSFCHKWSEQWLESREYGSNADLAGTVGGHVFWKQAELVEQRGRFDLLEVFYRCVLLGFKGERAGQPEKIGLWIERVSPLVMSRQRPFWEDDDVHLPASRLQGRKQLDRAVIALGIAAAVGVPPLAYLVIQHLGW